MIAFGPNFDLLVDKHSVLLHASRQPGESFAGHIFRNDMLSPTEDIYFAWGYEACKKTAELLNQFISCASNPNVLYGILDNLWTFPDRHGAVYTAINAVAQETERGWSLSYGIYAGTFKKDEGDKFLLSSLLVHDIRFDFLTCPGQKLKVLVSEDGQSAVPPSDSFRKIKGLRYTLKLIPDSFLEYLDFTQAARNIFDAGETFYQAICTKTKGGSHD